MRKNIPGSSLALLLMAVFFSCSEDVKPTPYTYTQVFTGTHSRTWKIRLFEHTLNGKVDDSFTVACAADDTFKFTANTDHSYAVTTGSTKCDPSEEDEYDDVWTFSNASATLTMIVPAFTTDGALPFIVREASGTKMVTEIFLDEANTESYRVHYDVQSED